MSLLRSRTRKKKHMTCAFLFSRNISQRLLGEQSSVRAEIMAAIVAIETAKDLGSFFLCVLKLVFVLIVY